jgi:prevent-host-death family protein
MEASTKDLRFHAAELLAATDRGEEVVITYRGRPRARLTGLAGPAREPLKGRNAAFGIWKHHDDDVDSYVRRLRQGRRFE